jgi:DNA processing protein
VRPNSTQSEIGYDPDNIMCLLALQSIQGIGHQTIKNLVAWCGNPAAVFDKKASGLLRVPGIGPIQARMITAKKDFSNEKKLLHRLIETNTQIISYFDSSYPERLRQLRDAPVLLYYRGKARLTVPRMLAVVGTRRSSGYGRKMCRQIIEGLTKFNVTIVSGLAYGIDITAHRAALKNNIPTIGVLAFGHDRMYPPEHSRTALEMLHRGALVSEYPPGTLPERERFPERNRIIAGLCEGVIVVETDLRGGANITADIAQSYDRDVFAVPGNADRPVAQGCHRLIKMHKAALVENAGDIAYQMGWDLLKNKKEPVIPTEKLTPEELKIVKLLQQYGQMDTDTICSRIHKPPQQISLVMLELECKGIVFSLPGNNYKLA